ncbi:histidine kinase [Streptomyces sp. NPDC048462]|uniref:sensor histidine kinase n=1 Tax=Streptomyces sp. NPDC048462 TaxID=3365555 RepID=UPI0037247632
MNRNDDRLIPVLLICVQAVVWPGAALLRGDLPSASALLVAALVNGPVAAALALRRTRPVTALVFTAATLALGAGPLPAGATAVLGTAGVALALFTVATERDTFTAVLCVVALAGWQFLYGLSLHGLHNGNGLDLALTALMYPAACGSGLLVRRERHALRATEQRLRRAESERHRLPAAERRRMERELHDVSAHHLTAVVVTVGAALGLRDRRPELAEDAARFAIETGHEVTRALGAVRAPAPSRAEQPSPQQRLLDLVAGFRRLGQQADCEIDALPDGTVGDAAFGIVREALTNVVRYAPGARTRVLCRYGDARTDVVVTSGAPLAGTVAHGAGLGGRRGQNFLRSRAREAGGTLTTGPTAMGGWEVRAVLPGRSAAAVERLVPRSYRVAQVTAAIGLVVQPLLPTLVIRAETVSGGGQVSAGAFFALLAAAQAVTLLWLRRAPRAVQGALCALALLWPVAMLTGDYTGEVLLPPALSLLATCAALAAQAAGAAGHRPAGDRPHRFLPAAVAAVHAVAATGAVMERGTALPLWEVAALSTGGAAAAVGAAWWAGTLRGRQGQAARRAREGRVADWTVEAVRDAWRERRRIASGLEGTVLARTADMVREAQAGRLEETAERARESLAGMRALLDTVRHDETGQGLRPQPTLQALDLLARQCRATGREVEIRLADRVPECLPTAVDLAAYHVAETVLTAGGTEPAVIELDAFDGTLTLTATGVTHAVHPAVQARLAVRIAALDGTITTQPAGTFSLRLPFAPGTTGGAAADAPPAVAECDDEEQRKP